MKTTQAQLQSALAKSWVRETSYTPIEWNEQRPSRGQCVVTALVIQDYLGGELQKLTTIYNNQPESHYRNLLPSGEILDATRSQYPDNQILEVVDINLKGFSSAREKHLDDLDALHRYEILKKNVEQNL